jgi:hypothetical protein
MRFPSRCFLGWTSFWLATSVFACAVSVGAQSDAIPQQDQTGVVLTKLYTPVYPRIARTARVFGDVDLQLQIRRDGSIQSVKYVGGVLLLARAALESAKQSEFECHGCTAEATTFDLIYSFRLVGKDPCKQPKPPNVSVHSGNQISIEASLLVGNCDPTGK